MSRKKQKKQETAREPVFSSNPFATLKTLDIATKEPVAAVKTPEPQQIPPLKTAKKTQDDNLFLQAMSGVRRLGTKAEKGEKTGKDKEIAAEYRGKATVAITKAATEPGIDNVSRKTFLQEIERLKLDVRFEDDLGVEESETAVLTGNRLRQLKRGILRINRQLDLHGLTRDEALSALYPFINVARQAGEKCLLVITGKGLHSTGEPILQQAVTSWLKEQGKGLVVEFAPAPKELGGSGAFVLFLRPLDKPVDR